jgi:hypothetical protein
MQPTQNLSVMWTLLIGPDVLIKLKQYFMNQVIRLIISIVNCSALKQSLFLDLLYLRKGIHL